MRSTFTFLVMLALVIGCYSSSENQHATNSFKTAVSANNDEPKESTTDEVVEPDMGSKSGKPDKNMDGSEKPAQDNLEKKATDAQGFGKTTLADALALVESGKAVLVDVRRDEEWNESHFESATHIPLDKINEDPQSAFAKISKEQTVFVH